MHQTTRGVDAPQVLTRQLRRFLVAGGAAVATDCLSYFTMSHAGVAYAPAKACSFIAGTIVAYVLNKFYTFERRDRSVAELFRFAALYLMTLTVNVLVNSAVLRLALPAITGVAFLAATGTSTVLNFIGQKFWVFADRSHSRLEAGQGAQALDYLPFALCFLCGVAMLLRSYPSLFLSGEMWAEAAINYFHYARFHSLGANLTALDYSYLPLLTRLLALAVEAFHPLPTTVPYVYQGLALVAVSACSACFALPQFRTLIQSDAMRGFVSLGFLFHPDYELKTFINFPYYAAIPCFLFLIMLPRISPLRLSAAAGAGLSVALLGLSKPHFASFLPMLGLLGLFGIARKRKDVLLVAGLGSVGILFQLGTIALHRNAAGDSSLGPRPPLGQLAGALGSWLWTIFRYSLAGRPALLSDLSSWPGIVLLVGAAALAVALVLWVRRGGLRRDSWPLVAAAAVALAGAALAVASFPQVLVLEKGTPPPPHLLAIRWWFVPLVCVYLSLACVVAHGLEQLRFGSLGLAAWLVLPYPLGLNLPPRDAGWPAAGYSAWQALSGSVLNEPRAAGCIPINPYPWMYAQGCKTLLPPPPAERFTGPRESVRTEGYAAPSSIGATKVEMIGLALRGAERSKDLELVAYGNSEAEISRAKPVRLQGPVMLFRFSAPISGIMRIRLAGDLTSLELTVQEPAQPVWLWFGAE